MLHRRAFALTLLAAVALRRPLFHPTQLRIAAVIPPETPDAALGLEFGAAEARRSAALFGWDVTISANVETAHAIVVGGAGPAPRANVPIIRIVHDAATIGDGSLCVMPDPSSGTLAWHPGLERFGAQQLNDRYRSATGRGMTGQAWGAWFAVKVVADSALRVRSTDPQLLLRYMRAAETLFDGHKGAPLRFDGAGHLIQPVYPAPTDSVVPRPPR